MRNNTSFCDHVTALSYQSSSLGPNKVLNDRNVTKSDQRLLCVTASISPPNDPSKKWRAARRLTAALGHTGVETCISANAARVASPPTLCTWTTNDDLKLCSRRRGATVITLPTQWHLHAASFYDRLVHRMRLCRVALSCSHCDIINQTLQIRCIGYRSAVTRSSPILQITTDVPMSDIIIGLTLMSIHHSHR